MTTITGHTTRANGTILTAAIYNFDHVNHIGNANNLNNDKIEGATPPVVDGHAVVFNGTSGAEIRTAGGPPLLTSVLPLSVANGGTGQITLGAAAAAFAANGAGFGPVTNLASAATTDLGTIPSHNVMITGTTGITSFGSSASVNTPVYLVHFATGPVTITNSANLILPANAGVMDFRAGDSFLAIYQGSGVWRVEHVVQVQFVGLAGFVNDFFMTNNGANPSTQLDIITGPGRLISPFGYPYEFGSVNGTLNAAINGAGGLDAGALAANTWYHIWLIATGNTSTALLSLSASSPTMPAGYTYKHRVGSIRTNVSGFFTRVIQKGNRTRYRVIGGSTTPNLPIMASGAAGNTGTPTWVAVPTGAFVPPFASSIEGVLSMTNSTSNIIAAPNNAHGAAGSAANPSQAWLSVRGAVPFNFILESTDIFWASADASGIIACAGWTDSVNVS